MLINTLRSEWLKLRTTKALYWTSGLYLGLSIAFALLMAAAVKADPNFATMFSAQYMLMMMSTFGKFIIGIQAALVITTEFSHKYQSATFLATPNRMMVAFAKWLVYAIVALILSFVTLVLTIYVAKFVVGGSLGQSLQIFGDEFNSRYLWLYPLEAVLYSSIGQAFGWLTRSTAAAVAFVVLVEQVETVLMFIPNISKYYFYLLPFSNWKAFSTRTDMVHPLSGEQAPWGWEGSLWYFLGFIAVLAVAALVTLRRRDV